MRPYSRTYAAIDLEAVRFNMEQMRQNLPAQTKILGVVKTDGYGHGAVPVAKAIEDYVEGYAVATLEEGMILRRHGIQKLILILGVTHPSLYPQLLDYDIRPTIFTVDQARPLSELARARHTSGKLHLAVDTGMSRIGLPTGDEGISQALEISRLPAIQVEGLFTHFARADETDKSYAQRQLRRYLDFAAELEARGLKIPLRHCSNSAAIVEGLQSNSLDMVRAGISIYGLYPSDQVGHSQVRLKPALELKSCITYVKTIEPGTQVSYGGTFEAEKPMRIATVPVGYGDGYPRSLSNKGQVLIRGRRANILGRVCMDQMMVDVTHIPEAEVDDEVVLIGTQGTERILAEEVSAISGRFPYELVCDLGKRVPRAYYRGGQLVGCKDYHRDQYESFMPV